MAGRVEAVGRNVMQFRPGDDVFGDIGHGGFAEYACARENRLASKPANLSFEEAAAVPMAALTALQGLRDKGRIQPGQKVLINGASGGVGTFAVQMGKLFEAEVTAVCSPGKMGQARSLGADIAGRVEAVGASVTQFRPGDEVFGVSAGSAGGFAEYACAAEDNLALKPANLSFEAAATVPEHPRHRTDLELRAAADTGGVSGIFIMPYLAKGAQPAAAHVIAHLQHAIKVAGEDHVSLGTDGYVSPSHLSEEYKQKFRANIRERAEAGIAAPFEAEEGYLFANDLNTSRRFETLAELLMQHGYRQSVVEKILGGNLLRVFTDSWNN